MKKEAIDKIEDEINKKTTMPDSLKVKTRKEIFINFVLAIGIILYFIFLIMGSVDSTKTSRTLDFRIFSLVLLFIAICLFEIAYKKDSGKIAINGIEFLVIALVTLFFPYIIFELDSMHQKYYFMISGYIAIYYIIKSIVISNRAKIKYEKQESDIKEIIKKEEKKIEYLDDEFLEDKILEKNSNIKNKVKKLTNEKTKRDFENRKDIEEKTAKKVAKRGRPKKIKTDLNNSYNTKKEIMENTKSRNNNKIKAEKNIKKSQGEDKPKKRGRPRKVVNN